jgi:hypothetical protein
MSDAPEETRFQRGTLPVRDPLPCPFCYQGSVECFGENLEREHLDDPFWVWSVKCHDCSAHGPEGFSEKEAWEGWGRGQRAPDDPPLPVPSETIARCMHLARKHGASDLWTALAVILDPEARF